MSTNMSAGWAEFFNSFKDDLTRDMEYARMQSHQTFLNNLKRQDSDSGYVIEGKPLSNFEYSNLSEDQKKKAESAAKYTYNNQLSLLDQQRQNQIAVEKERSQMATDRDLARAKAAPGIAAEEERARIGVQNEALDLRIKQNQEKYSAFKKSDGYQKLPEAQREVFDTMGSFGIDFSKAGEAVLKSMTAKVERQKLDPQIFKAVGEVLQTNRAFMTAAANDAPAAMYMWQEAASMAQGLPDQSAQNFLNAVSKTLAAFASYGPEEKKKEWKRLEEMNPKMFTVMDGLIGNSMFVSKEGKVPKEGEKKSFKGTTEDWGYFNRVFTIQDLSGRGSSMTFNKLQKQNDRGKASKVDVIPGVGEQGVNSEQPEDTSIYSAFGSLLDN